MDDADKAETLIRNLARRLEQGLEGRFCFDPGRDSTKCSPSQGLACRRELRRSLACTNIIENIMGTVRQGLPQRKILALAVDGPAMGGRRHAGSRQGLPAIESLQAVAGS